MSRRGGQGALPAEGRAYPFCLNCEPSRPLNLFQTLEPCFPGTRIIYDRKFLLDRRNSPMAQTPPCHLPNIPGVTSPGTLIEDSKVEVNNLNNLNNHDRKHAVGDDAQFEMDI
uniref:Eukaryotic translation initiation factor 4E binding protein 2 n=1 Tax=Ursus maritimus TaxID=29073 RepID=A0A452TQT9_URSMA